MSEPTQTSSDEIIREVISPVDYAIIMRDTLTRLQEGLDTLNATVIPVPNLLNLVNSSLDYLFYLEDNRRVIL
jgi:hypothetical protein